jgi:hypothetical protein
MPEPKSNAKMPLLVWTENARETIGSTIGGIVPCRKVYEKRSRVL